MGAGTVSSCQPADMDGAPTSLTQIESPRGSVAGGHVFNGPQHPGIGPAFIHVKPGRH